MPTYHCKRCRYTSRSIGAMGKHYRKKHPRAMKRKKRKKSKRRATSKEEKLLRLLRELL